MQGTPVYRPSLLPGSAPQVRRQKPARREAFSRCRNRVSAEDKENSLRRLLARGELLYVIHFAQPVGPLQHFARLAAVRWTNDAVAIHHVQNPRRTPVSEAEPPLQ